MRRKLFIATAVLLFAVLLAFFGAAGFAKPFLKNRLSEALERYLGREMKFAGLDIGLMRGVILVKGLEIQNPSFMEYYGSAAADDVIMDIDLPLTLLRQDLVFEKVYVKGLFLRLESKKKPPAPAEKEDPRVSASERIPSEASNPSLPAKKGLRIKNLLVEDSRLTFEHYLEPPAPVIIELTGLNGSLKDVYAAFDGSFVSGTVDVTGRLNSGDESPVKIEGLFAKKSGDVDFDLDLDLSHASLVRFAPYYSRTSFTILKQAKIDLRSDASCRKNALDAHQRVRIYDIKLNVIKATDEDILFGLPAKTVIKFFKQSGGEVEFDFNVAGTIDDPKFGYGPVIEQVLAKALQEKIAARLRELPREVIKMSEKAVRDLEVEYNHEQSPDL